MDKILNDEINGILGKILSGNSIEIEVRFSEFTKGGGGISPESYNYILEKLENDLEFNIEPDEIKIVYLHPNNLRVIVDSNTDKTTYQKKSSYGYKFIEEYGFKLSISTETIFKGKITSSHTIERKITRKKFSYLTVPIYIDISRVEQSSKGKMKINFELEIDYTGNINDFKNYKQNFVDVCYKIFNILHNTINIYTLSEYNNLLTKLGELFPKNSYKKRYLPQVEPLKASHIKWGKGGLLGDEDTRYVMTYKADGTRSFFIKTFNCIWIVYNPYNVNLIYRIETGDTNFLIENSPDFIFDGEIVISEDTSNVLFKFYIFDVLKIGNEDYTKEHFRDRLQEYQKFMNNHSQNINNILVGIMSVHTKKTTEIRNPQQFFNEVKLYLEEKIFLDYDIDGLIFTKLDIGSLYFPDYNKNYSLKWKYKTTIDFKLIKNKKNESYIFMTIDKQGLEKEFKGSQKFVFDPNIIIGENIKLDQIIEFEYDPDSNELRAIRNRPDKKGPNKYEVALSNWNEMNSPITEETLSGMNIFFTSRYHNRIKKDLFDNISEDLNSVILNIGAGRGGDIMKMTKFSKIINIEPDEENLKILEKRLEGFPSQMKKTYNFKLRGEDYETVSNEVSRLTEGKGVDCISLMLCLSFFWKTQFTINDLISTISRNLKKGGKIIFLTIDGYALDQLFYSEKTEIINIGNIVKFSLGEKNLYGGRSVTLDIPNSIVGIGQQEYFTYLDDFTIRLKRVGIELNFMKRATEELFLSDDNKLFSNLYTYGMYECIRNDVVPMISIFHSDNMKERINVAYSILIPPCNLRQMRIIIDLLQLGLLYVEKYIPELFIIMKGIFEGKEEYINNEKYEIVRKYIYNREENEIIPEWNIYNFIKNETYKYEENNKYSEYLFRINRFINNGKNELINSTLLKIQKNDELNSILDNNEIEDLEDRICEVILLYGEDFKNNLLYENSSYCFSDFLYLKEYLENL